MINFIKNIPWLKVANTWPVVFLSCFLVVTGCSTAPGNAITLSQKPESVSPHYVFKLKTSPLSLNLNAQGLTPTQIQAMDSWLTQRKATDITLNWPDSVSAKVKAQLNAFMRRHQLVDSQVQLIAPSENILLTEWHVTVAGCDTAQSYTFGCNNYLQLLAMTAVKADLAQGRNLTPSLGMQAVSAVAAYNKGQVRLPTQNNRS